MSRRRWLALLLGGAALGTCRPTAGLRYPVRLLGPDRELGHRLRQADFPRPTETRTTGTLIVGGGVAGLVAGWRLHEGGRRDFHILELEREAGGNSRNGRNALTAYPLGAHYLTQPNPLNEPLIGFLQQIGVITGFTEGLPQYDEACLCAEPAERLLFYDRWQNGLLPKSPLSHLDRQQIDRFLARVHALKHERSPEGRYRFDSPLNLSVFDAAADELEGQSFADWLDAEGFTARPLRWYLEYCCRDEYGGLLAGVSAWAGLHYFAARRPRAANADPSTVLVWPQGNGWLVGRLLERLREHVQGRQLVFRLTEHADHVEAWVYDAVAGRSLRWQAERLVLAVPQHVAARLLPEVAWPSGGAQAPWLVANITLRRPPAGWGEELAWDNVRYGGASLGYVVATHQLPCHSEGPTVVTLYHVLTDGDAGAARRLALNRSATDWAAWVEAELETMHPGIGGDIIELELWVWGHGMACPVPGRLAALRAFRAGWLRDRIALAHTDWSGLSTFEEAFDQGWRAI